MSIKNLLGLRDVTISDHEIIAKVSEAQSKNLTEVEFIRLDGSIVRIKLPRMGFDPAMDKGS
ncbi:hypothetical protein KY342_03715 [Candidatus Woesearchaeota archaeon]|nr:hypothetical protein [Candidatus Woesearchaeota archaeon]